MLLYGRRLFTIEIPMRLLPFLLSQLHNICALRLDFTFVSKSVFPELMLKHVLFTTPKGILSTFKCLAFADYGSNGPISTDSEYVEGGNVDDHSFL